ncbi:bifunctional riboflavin kinase/FAD synthetase [Rathayibacter rathayi]|uniref:Riboflavin biosynthesis protein n=1 Tax=Rathayibacter rathayi TaxID=33887 RepID=A0ABD6WCS7_RATRA|nr:bifunctional riboflavin kinase/FAD synthetase [Rathayibacter rathayi]AZZ50462.1 bifunctional riboflavin kinase/FAD synthetase [Rathayibacter rathayi]MWV73195.1 bifunctional riboflavin kinase/FAD synthetase [Rathayibacter rathayi NCPPB 2980 = VKM Ac-1601]PPF16288.1 bifunctional riboflavin kinase/FAD synthetase [Rathayibacter rathayi]PPF52050.1 bifunctional riboflavin kinase/FAD synthetase [Rathayibacter rathayi]PPF83670.1 bifunctional riboflavin kinase/FAD synthetase [Rathayibacter rathayi]
MRVETRPGDLAGIGPSAVTIGKFDGVHSGHRAVIGTLHERARERALAAVVVTFDRNPLSVIAPEKCPPVLVGNEQKLELLAGTGVDATLLLTFDEEFRALSPEEFVRQVLVDALGARVVLVGSDFRFGARGAGDVGLLRVLGRRYGFEVELIDDVRPEDGRRVSSTWIRELLAEGDVEHASRLLGHEPVVRGVVVHGAKRGRELGFPTANLSPQSQGLIPADGVYAGRLSTDGVTRPAAISVGSNPTFVGVPPKQVEAYVLDQTVETLDLYDRVVDVAFVRRIRGQVAYEGVEPLIRQMNQDVLRVREVLGIP